MQYVKKIMSDYIPLIYVLSFICFVFACNVIMKCFADYGYDVQRFSQDFLCFLIIGFVIYVINRLINKIDIDIYDILILLLTIFGIISMKYSVNPVVSLNGFEGRYEGLIQLMTYYILFLNCKGIKNDVIKKIIIGIIIAMTVLQALCGILQFFKIYDLFGLDIRHMRYYSAGLEKNSNFFGSLMLIGLSLSLIIYLFKNNVWVSILTFISTNFTFFGLLCSGAMSVTVGLFVLLFFTILLVIISKVNWRYMIPKVILIILCSVAIYNTFNERDNGYYFSQIDKTTNEMGNMVSGNVQGIYGSGRIHIWTEALKLVPHNWINGVGIDAFFEGFGENKLIDVKSHLYVDKAHNEYLQKLVTEGVFSFITYMTLLILLVIRGGMLVLKERKREEYFKKALLLCVIAYCVQAFFNISVISIAPLFYIVLGLLCSFVKGGKNEAIRN